MNGTFEVILGAILSIGITIWVEYLGKPKLKFRASHVNDVDYSRLPEKRPATNARFLSLVIENKRLSLPFRWLSRNAALQCHATIDFFHLDGQNVFGRNMIGRWLGSAEPIPAIQISGEGINIEKIVVSGGQQATSSTINDIYPGEKANLDIAARFDRDIVCYGWNDEGYFSNPLWRNPKWELPSGRYIVKVELVSSGDKSVGYYRLVNDVDISSFRLEEAREEDIKQVK